MSHYILKFYNHLQAVQHWCQRNEASVSIDGMSFELEIKAHNRYYKFFPQYWQRAQGRITHTSAPTEHSFGFLGWRPYKPFPLPQLQNKLFFKQLVSGWGFRCPDAWDPSMPAPHDYILKDAVGSFGTQLSGPYSQHTPADVSTLNPQAANQAPRPIFAEQLITGDILKIWFWAGRPFYMHRHAWPTVLGNDQSTIGDLIEVKLQSIGQSWNTYHEARYTEQALRYQGVDLQTVLRKGQSAWLDYRYGRRFQYRMEGLDEDNAWPQWPLHLQTQTAQIGAQLAQHMRAQMNAPILFAVDAIVDAHEQLWWLEVNSNPMVPPPLYELMLNTLFARSKPSAELAPAGSVPA